MVLDLHQNARQVTAAMAQLANFVLAKPQQYFNAICLQQLALPNASSRCVKHFKLTNAQSSDVSFWNAGFQLDDMAFATLFKAFNPDCTNWLSIAEYIALTLFLQSASATFKAFDQQKKGVVTLNFNQWIYATANVV